jgi:energy-coupling factor transporter ATP-binding protein EcfA2
VAEVGGAFAWPSFLPPAKKAKQDPASEGIQKNSSAREGSSIFLSTSRSALSASVWAEKYFPTLEEELAVHKKKVGEVKTWLENQLQPQSEANSSKVLLLVGPPGAGKSTTVHVLCGSLNLQVVEWQTPVPTLWEEHVHLRGVGPAYTSKLDEFDTFLDKAEKFPLVPLVPSLATLSLGSQSSAPRLNSSKLHSSSSQPSVDVRQGKLVLIDDMPLAAEGDRRQRLCHSLETLARSARFPTVVILSEGEAGQPGQRDGQSSWGATAAFQQALENGAAANVRDLAFSDGTPEYRKSVPDFGSMQAYVLFLEFLRKLSVLE